MVRSLNPHLRKNYLDGNSCMKAHAPRPTRVCINRGEPPGKDHCSFLALHIFFSNLTYCSQLNTDLSIRVPFAGIPFVTTPFGTFKRKGQSKRPLNRRDTVWSLFYRNVLAPTMGPSKIVPDPKNYGIHTYENQHNSNGSTKKTPT